MALLGCGGLIVLGSLGCLRGPCDGAQLCDVEQVGRTIAGEAADCGTFGVGADPSAGRVCATERLAGGSPFVLVTHSASAGSIETDVLLYRGDRLLRLSHDSGARSVLAYECVWPTLEASGSLACGDHEPPSGERYRVCGADLGEPALPEPWASLAAPALPCAEAP